MKKAVLITSIILGFLTCLLLLLGVEYFYFGNDGSINNLNNKVDELDKKLDELNNEKNKVYEENKEKIDLLELWKKELEKAKNY